MLIIAVVIVSDMSMAAEGRQQAAAYRQTDFVAVSSVIQLCACVHTLYFHSFARSFVPLHNIRLLLLLLMLLMLCPILVELIIRSFVL